MAIEDDVYKPVVPHLVELFELDGSPFGEYTYRFSSCSEGYTIDNWLYHGAPSFGGWAYNPIPIQITGIGFSLEDAPARPKLSIACPKDYPFIAMLNFWNDDFVGGRVTYIRTFSTYMNLPTKISAPPLVYTIAKKEIQTNSIVTYELRSSIDKERTLLPKRQMLRKDFPGLGVNKNYK